MESQLPSLVKLFKLSLLGFAAICILSVSADPTVEEFNVTRRPLIVSESLARIREAEDVWHWSPWLRARTMQEGRYIVKMECLSGDSVESFPDSIFTEEQLRMGAFLLYVLFGIYAFTLLAIICNDYFIPCVEFICEDLNIPVNVGAATFMAVATSCPEFFVNVISTFLTESSMGIGTIVGSALFNALGVAAIGSIASVAPIKIDRRPVTRDVIVYLVVVSILVAFIWDGTIYWYEALVLTILYILYFVLMFNSERIFALYDRCRGRNHIVDNIKSAENNVTANSKERSEPVMEEGGDNKEVEPPNTPSVVVEDNIEISVKDDYGVKKYFGDIGHSVISFPKKRTFTRMLWYWYTLPLRCILALTIPSPHFCRPLYPLSFIMCIVWIGANSYCVTWSMTVLGNTFFIPESIMGMTFLAFGGCLPEACSIYIMSRRGEGSMGVSNALGANSLAVLFALGVPWLAKSLALLGQGEVGAVHFDSSGLEFAVASLLLATICLYVSLWVAGFFLRRRLGIVLVILYLIFITFAILVEMGLVFNIDVLSLC